MNVLSLFDGMSCGQIALDQLGIEVENYYACEIDKWAIKTTKKNYPNTIHLGDVCEVKGKELPKIDLLIGGSPCQGFSFAGKQLNFDDPRSALFFEYVRLLKETKPKYFLLENVRMKQEYQDVISEHLGVKPIMINSSLLSAQNRVRLYWTNIPNITQPEDKGVVLKDILEGGVVDRDKSHCLDANYFKGGNLKSYFEKHRRQLVFSKDGLCHVGDADINGNDSIKRVYHEDGKAPCLTTMGGGNREPKVFCGRIVGRKINPETGKRDDNNPDLKIVQQLESRKDEKSGCLTTVQKDNVVIEQLTYRKLTPLECERLQTVAYVEKNVKILLCLDQAKNYVSAVIKNPKLQKLVLSAEKSELRENVNNVVRHINASPQSTKPIVQPSADMQTQKQTKRCTQTKLKEETLNVETAEKKTINSCQKREECSATLNVFINSTEGKITHLGKEELHQNDNNSTLHRSGKVQLSMCGVEMMQLVKDVERGLATKKNSNFTSTISNHLSMSNLEQMLIISYFFAESVIDGYIPRETQNISLSFQMNDGYTEGVSNTARYKMLGNGWTVEVIKHIFKNMK